MGLGILLGILNLIVIAFGLAGVMGDGDVVILVGMFGGLPALCGGALIGAAAHWTRRAEPGLRRIVLIVPALAIMAMLAITFDMGEFILVSAIPTTVAALILESKTRQVEPPPIPEARKL